MKLDRPTDVPYRAAHLLAGLLEGLDAGALRHLWLVDDPEHPALVGTTARSVRISRDHGGVDEWDLADVRTITTASGHVRLRMAGGSEVGIPWAEGDSLADLLSELRRPHVDAAGGSPDVPAGTPAERAPTVVRVPDAVPLERITSLDAVPGRTVDRSLGAVTVIAAGGGWTAEHRGREALERAMSEIGAAAGRRGADAVVGLSVSAFGARSSVAALNGDAIGIVLLGTAVVLEPAPE